MIEWVSLRQMIEYNDWANEQVLTAAGPLSDAQLDQPLEIGMGSLRKTLIHLYNGEYVWLQRWKGLAQTPWPSEEEPIQASQLLNRFQAHHQQRHLFLQSCSNTDLVKIIRYRDSKGSYFQATLGDMILQACVHSIHHRAQIVNMLRRLGVGLVELDYMMRIRQSVRS